MILEVIHRTSYRYDTPVHLGYSEARLLPRDTTHQRVVHAELRADPPPVDTTDRLDHLGNRVTYLRFADPHDRITVTARSVVLTATGADRPDGSPRPLDGPGLLPSRDAGTWEAAVVPALAGDPAIADAALPSPLVEWDEDVVAYAAPSFPAGRPLHDAVLELTRRIHRDFRYRPGATTIATSVGHVLERGEGVCQDFAHLAVACLRALGLPARYVSGYVETDPPPGQARLEGADASHAWFAVHAPGAGWLHLDPTNDQVVDERYVVLGWGRDYADVTPLKGVVFNDGGAQHLEVRVDVVRHAAVPILDGEP